MNKALLLSILVLFSTVSHAKTESRKPNNELPPTPFKLTGKEARQLFNKMSDNNFKWTAGDFGVNRYGKVICSMEGNVDSPNAGGNNFKCELVSQTE